MFGTSRNNHSVIIRRPFPSSQTEVPSPPSPSPGTCPSASCLCAVSALGASCPWSPTMPVPWCLDSSKMAGHGRGGLGGVLDLRVGVRFKFIRIKSPFFTWSSSGGTCDLPLGCTEHVAIVPEGSVAEYYPGFTEREEL